jgi:Flp pilus assembly protein TadD
MRPAARARAASLRRRAFVLAAALGLSACATPGATRPAPIELREPGGFTITEKVRVSGSVRADFERAVGLLQQERYESGIALLVEVTEAAPGLTAAHIDLAIAYGRVGDLPRAEASLKTALELNPRHPVVHNELGILYRRTGRFAEARQSYEKALALQPEFHFARRNLAILCDLYLADRECALEHYQAYTQAVPDDEAAAIWVADLRARAGR